MQSPEFNSYVYGFRISKWQNYLHSRPWLGKSIRNTCWVGLVTPSAQTRPGRQQLEPSVLHRKQSLRGLKQALLRMWYPRGMANRAGGGAGHLALVSRFLLSALSPWQPPFPLLSVSPFLLNNKALICFCPLAPLVKLILPKQPPWWL